MRLTSWNLLHGEAMPPSKDADNAALLAAEIEHLRSDIIGLQEVDYFLARSGNHNQVGNVADMMQAKDWAFAPSLMGSPDDDWRNPNENDEKIVTDSSQVAFPGYGIGIVSKIPVTSWHRLDLKGSPVGVLMAFPVDGKLKRFYVRDHPRSALGAVLENGWLVINTHLSFVPFVNYRQLRKIKKWAAELSQRYGTQTLIIGDMNLPKGLPALRSAWNSLVEQNSYPSWGAKIQFDYILSDSLKSDQYESLPTVVTGVSDHLPVRVKIL